MESTNEICNIPEYCLRLVECEKTCDAVDMCQAVPDGFQLELFNGITHDEWVEFGRLDDTPRSTVARPLSKDEPSFDLEARLQEKMEERRELGHDFSSSGQNSSIPQSEPVSEEEISEPVSEEEISEQKSLTPEQ